MSGLVGLFLTLLVFSFSNNLLVANEVPGGVKFERDIKDDISVHSDTPEQKIVGNTHLEYKCRFEVFLIFGQTFFRVCDYHVPVSKHDIDDLTVYRRNISFKHK